MPSPPSRSQYSTSTVIAQVDDVYQLPKSSVDRIVLDHQRTLLTHIQDVDGWLLWNDDSCNDDGRNYLDLALMISRFAITPTGAAFEEGRRQHINHGVFGAVV